jgi:DNA-directed RNA polymerase beta subunit
MHYKFNENSNKENKHYFMSEELLIPRANATDTQRINMFANHLNQFIHLVKPEFPKVFTRFENQVGEYSVAYKEAEEDFTIISKIWKNAYNYDLIIQYKSSKVYDILHYRNAVNITEDYGYSLEDCIPDKNEGDTLYKGDYVFKSSNYDNDKNYMYGVNLKAIYLPYKNLTYEDGIVISESTAEKLKAHKVEQTMFSINSNDILLNLYGDKFVYKSFPRVGEEVNSKALVAIRRIDFSKVLYDFQTNKLRTIDSKDDVVIYSGGGKVVDIDIFSNIPLDKLKQKPNEFNNEIIEVYEAQQDYYKKLAEELEKIIPVRDKESIVVEHRENKKQGVLEAITEARKEKEDYGYVTKSPIPKEENSNKFSDELAYYWKLSHEMIDENIKWRHEGKTFDNFKMRFTILKENPITEGAKLTGRYGNKGIVSMIVPDNEMPVTEEGIRAEIILNPLGILNRLNIAQIQEQYLNFMADRLIQKLKELRDGNDLFGMEDEFFDFMKAVNPELYDFLDMEYMMLNRTKKQDFFNEVIEKGIFIHQQPFFENTSMDTFAEIFKDRPHLIEEYKFKNIEKPMLMGDLYFIRLKHEASNKTSARATSLSNLKSLPSKSVLKKEKKILLSQTPIRLGEMEVTNLLIPKRGDLVEKLLKSHSTSNEDKERLIYDLLTSETPLKLNTQLTDSRSINRDILQKYLNVLGLDLEE